MSSRHILIIDDEEGIRSSLALILADEGYAVRTAADADEGLEIAGESTFDVVLCDVRMPRTTGLDALPHLLRKQPGAIIVMMSAYGDAEQALEAVRLGAHDYLSKPFQAQELLLTLSKAEERERLKQENRRLRRRLSEGQRERNLVVGSSAMKEIHELIEGAARYKTTVLVTGESGVGKEVVARTLHSLSDRRDKAFIAVNCGAIPASLIESELFGHAKGAFTGADSDKPGLFREADGGTLFLDEIGEIPPAIQVKLLRVLQEEEVQPVGKPRPVEVDVRIVAATARDLEVEISAGRFREDLFYRLNVFRIHIPPLRDRPEDIPPLAAELLERLAARLGKSVMGIEEDALGALCAHPWMGNVRELENALERAMILSKTERLTADLFSFRGSPVRDRDDAAATIPDGDLSIKRQGRLLEQRLIRAAMKQTGGKRSQAAEILEISLRALQYKLKEYDIVPLNPAKSRSDSGNHRDRSKRE